MKTEFLAAGLLASASTLADTPATPMNPSETPGTVVISSAIEAKCFAEAAAQALASGQANWWQSSGYKSAAEWFAAALGYAVAGISADAKFDVTRLNDGGSDRLDFKANISSATLVLAATTAKGSASRFAKTWRYDWAYNPRYAGVTWVSGQARASRKGVGGSNAAGAAETGASVGNVISITGAQIGEFRNQLTLNAGAWSNAGSNAYASLFDRAAAAMGQRISAKSAAAAGKALASAISRTVLLADVDLHYKTQEGRVVIDETKINLACGASTAVTAEGYATPD